MLAGRAGLEPGLWTGHLFENPKKFSGLAAREGSATFLCESTVSREKRSLALITSFPSALRPAYERGLCRFKGQDLAARHGKQPLRPIKNGLAAAWRWSEEEGATDCRRYSHWRVRFSRLGSQFRQPIVVIVHPAVFDRTFRPTRQSLAPCFDALPGRSLAVTSGVSRLLKGRDIRSEGPPTRNAHGEFVTP
jgi:hypothetical protein